MLTGEYPTVQEAFFEHICKLEGRFQDDSKQSIWDNWSWIGDGHGIYWEAQISAPEISIIVDLYDPHQSLENIWKSLGYKNGSKKSK